MDFKQLTALVTVAEAGSVTRAAQLLHLVQPAVTRQIKTLEDELGVPLFERTRQGMRPTDAGAVLVDRARRALAELERARAEIRPHGASVSGIATVGLLESSVDIVAAPLVQRLRERHPGIRLRLLSAYSGDLQRWLDGGDVEVSLLYNLRSTPSLQVRPLLRERLQAIAAPGSGLEAGRPVGLTQLARHPLVMPASGHGLRVLVDQAFERADTVPEVALETNSMAVQKESARAGIGWTILPAAAVVQDVAAGDLVAAPLDDPAAVRDVVLGLARTRRIAPAVSVVAEALAALIEELVETNVWPAVSMRDEGR